jgi:hypothetical protein
MNSVPQTEVQAGGKVEVLVPLPPGNRVQVLVVPEDADDNLMKAATSSMDFWDNPIDDTEWNNA